MKTPESGIEFGMCAFVLAISKELRNRQRQELVLAGWHGKIQAKHTLVPAFAVCLGINH